MTKFPETMPRAWMGYAPQPLTASGKSDRGKPCIVVKICAWCPDKAQADALAKLSDTPATHGICPECARKLQDQVAP